MDFEAPIIVFLAVVAPIWIIAHYATRWRATKSLSTDEEQLLEELWKSAERMEQRINSLERILDAEVTDWRKKL
ncbi:envelope stress response membrane protein PspB [Pelagibius litoralis]|uniref:Envelope stress response membrane protein PspB n=1 Tax=Pelagibius litoralis TaxID=374515 RepID=A0A967C277_9PROT|nr:envelope stress response membrane protein PspB [Pelagibius litoralis]NIA68018.1 envelope stress response membrane protein PspB [Pelagibius litoralis]